MHVSSFLTSLPSFFSPARRRRKIEIASEISFRVLYHLSLSQAHPANMTSFLLPLIYFLLMSLPISVCDARNTEAHAKFTSCGRSKGMASARPVEHTAPSSSAQEMASHIEEVRAQNGTPEGGQEANDLNCFQREEKKEEEEAAAASASSGARSTACSSSVVKAKSSLKINSGGRGARAEQPGFDVDYIGPRTHPPSHN